MRDSFSEQRIAKLHPKVRAIFTKFIDDAESGLDITLRVAQGLRTIDEQNELYAQGRTKPGKKVTNAKGGSSYHNYGLAIDVLRMNGKEADWNYDTAKLLPYMPAGMVWGGNFKTIKDKPHFEFTFGINWRTLLAKYNKKEFIPGTQYVFISEPRLVQYLFI